METRASHKNDCKRPALKEKLVTEEGDLLGLAPPLVTAVSAEEVETEEVEEPFFPTIGARVMGLEKQDGGQNGDDNDDGPQLQESLNERSIVPENEKQYLHDELSMQNKLLALEETIRWLMTSWLVVYHVQSNVLKECRLRVRALSNRADALRNQETLIQQKVSKEVQLLSHELRQKVCNLEARVEQLQRMVIKKTIESSKDAELNPSCRRCKAILCWACHQESHKMAQCPGIIRTKIPVIKEDRTFCIKCKIWYGSKVCYCKAN